MVLPPRKAPRAERPASMLMKRVLGGGVALVAAAILLMTPATANAAQFPDVGSQDWFAEAVDVLSDQGIVQGKADGAFRPYESISRAEFSVLLSRCLGLSSGSAHPFTDIAAGDWFEPAVSALFEAGLVNGVTEDRFDPTGRVSRQQAASFIVRALNQVQPIEAAEDVVTWLQGFPDRDIIAGAHQPAVADAYRLGLVNGQRDGRFYPLAEVTRAQTAGILYAAFFKAPEPLQQPPEPVSSYPPYPDASQGSRGPHVLWLEQRLAQLSYRPGAIDGVFDDRTRHAVIAFQKWEGLGRDGMVGPQTWVRLAAASRPTAARSGSGIWIEVSLAKQVFLYIQDGAVVRTLPTSTGRSFTYRSAPYTVLRKPIADGPRYRALYLEPGYVLAIHGYPSVPTYPASDGCVRLPMRDMDDLRAFDGSNPMIPNGTLVYIG